MAFYTKLKWILGILMVFAIIVTTNLIDRNSFLRVNDSVVGIYEDRLVAYDLIFEMSKALQEKQLAVATSNEDFFLNRNSQIDREIQELISSFKKTKLTKEEDKLLIKFTTNLTALKSDEVALIQSKYTEKNSVNNQIVKLQQNLTDLSKVQLQEGQRKMEISKSAIDVMELFTHLEIYILIILAILIQIIVIYKPKTDIE